MAVADGKTHDFKMFKDMGLKVDTATTILADLGFLGINKLHKNSQIPHKSSKKKPIDNKQKAENRDLAKRRIPIEHVNRSLKIFKILQYPYRSRQERFALRVHLMAAIYNLNLNAA